MEKAFGPARPFTGKRAPLLTSIFRAAQSRFFKKASLTSAGPFLRRMGNISPSGKPPAARTRGCSKFLRPGNSSCVWHSSFLSPRTTEIPEHSEEASACSARSAPQCSFLAVAVRYGEGSRQNAIVRAFSLHDERAFEKDLAGFCAPVLARERLGFLSMHAFSPAARPAERPVAQHASRARQAQASGETRPGRARLGTWRPRLRKRRAGGLVPIRAPRRAAAHRPQARIPRPRPPRRGKALAHHLLCRSQAVSQARGRLPRVARRTGSHPPQRRRPCGSLSHHAMAGARLWQRVHPRHRVHVRESRIQARRPVWQYTL